MQKGGIRPRVGVSGGGGSDHHGGGGASNGSQQSVALAEEGGTGEGGEAGEGVQLGSSERKEVEIEKLRTGWEKLKDFSVIQSHNFQKSDTNCD